MTTQDAIDLGIVSGFLFLASLFGFAAAEIASGWMS